ncbi:hypothetical protein NQ315_011194 [Exocentrus adspersus]|uniref:Uncharacterized protein n=1 Tax=Exocentrus adspersus TaxID=1586481 RepID=A0AAV8V6H3_9CUCU|nr:hypothetical protein NQ315_011194 [Exocentrus adspersus]
MSDQENKENSMWGNTDIGASLLMSSVNHNNEKGELQESNDCPTDAKIMSSTSHYSDEDLDIYDIQGVHLVAPSSIMVVFEEPPFTVNGHVSLGGNPLFLHMDMILHDEDSHIQCQCHDTYKVETWII